MFIRREGFSGRMMWVSKQFEGEAVESEKWYGTKYSLQPLDLHSFQASGSIE